MEDALEAGLIGEDQVPQEFKEKLGITNGRIIGTFVQDMVRNSLGKGYIAVSSELGNLLHELIKFNNERIYHSEQAEGYKNQAGKTITYLFDDLLRELRRTNRFKTNGYPIEKKDDHVPPVYRVFRQFVVNDMGTVYQLGDPDELIVLDFIAGMTDSFAIRSISDVFIPKMMV